jgi:hypothetical protein
MNSPKFNTETDNQIMLDAFYYLNCTSCKGFKKCISIEEGCCEFNCYIAGAESRQTEIDELKDKSDRLYDICNELGLFDMDE